MGYEIYERPKLRAKMSGIRTLVASDFEIRKQLQNRITKLDNFQKI